MKILFVLHYPPPIHGSAVVGGIIKKSKVIQNRFDCRFVNLSLSKSIDDIEKKNPRKIYRYLKLLGRTLKLLVLFRPDLCYMTPVSKGPGFYKDSVVVILVKLFCPKVVYHFHNKGVILRQDRFFDNLLYRYVFGNAFVILLSKLLYPDIKKYVTQENVFYCPNGIPPLKDHHKFRVSTRVQFPDAKQAGIKIDNPDLNFMIQGKINVQKGDVRLLFLSNLIRSKGVLTLIEACKILKSRKLNFQCIITGDNGDLTRNDLQEMVSLEGLNRFVTITGAIYGEDKNQLISSSDIMVHPTQNDCLPLVLLEAMQQSLPIVSTFEGAIPDIIEDNISGLLVPKNNPVALADKLEQLIVSSNLRERMGRAGFNRYEKEFTQKIFENNLAEILEEIIKRK